MGGAEAGPWSLAAAPAQEPALWVIPTATCIPVARSGGLGAAEKGGSLCRASQWEQGRPPAPGSLESLAKMLVRRDALLHPQATPA